MPNYQEEENVENWGGGVGAKGVGKLTHCCQIDDLSVNIDYTR